MNGGVGRKEGVACAATVMLRNHFAFILIQMVIDKLSAGLRQVPGTTFALDLGIVLSIALTNHREGQTVVFPIHLLIPTYSPTTRL